MTGKNTLQLNEATMMQMVQHYFDEHLFKDACAPTVKSVRGLQGPTDVQTFEVVMDRGE